MNDQLRQLRQLMTLLSPAVGLLAMMVEAVLGQAAELEPLRYQHPGLVVDLGVGLWAWPLPLDFDGDGDLDLVVSCPDVPFNGTYLFENPGDGRDVFKPPRRISRGLQNVQISWVNGQPRIMTPGAEYPDFRGSGLEHPQALAVDASFHKPVGQHSNKIRANQWKYADLDGDGAHDLIVGIDDWSDYGWDDAFDANGRWTHGPLHGFVYWLRNQGDDERPQYGPPARLQAGGADIDVFGWPTPNLADFDGDGDLDLMCGEFLDAFTYFENVGSVSQPRFAAGRRLTHDGRTVRMDLQMIVPVAIDWDHDDDQDLIVGDEDGRVAIVEHTGVIVDGQPQFLPPRYFQQEADLVKCGALATPSGVDWDGDGDDDLLIGNTAGYVEYFENLGLVADSSQAPESRRARPRWAAPVRLRAGGETLRVQAGPNGSIQGPCEAKWGYTAPTAADWDHDGLPDVVFNSIWGRIMWCRNIGSRTAPRLAPAADIEVAWDGPPPKPAWNWWNPTARQLVTQWRTTPAVVDWNNDGGNDLVMLDHEGYLAYFSRARRGDAWVVLPGQRILQQPDGTPLRLNDRRAGGSGRRKLLIVDWDGDGQRDLLVNGLNADWWRQTSHDDSRAIFANQGPISERVLSSHTTSPTTVDWNKNQIPDLLIGAEDGHLYYLER